MNRHLRITWHLPAVLGVLGLVGAGAVSVPWLTSSPPRVVHLRGTHYEMGVEHGRLLREDIREVYDAYVLRGLVAREGRVLASLARSARHFEQFTPQTLRDEMRGIADGSGVPYEQILIINTFGDAILGGGRLCSAVAIRGDHGILVGRNLDWVNHGVAHRTGVVFILEPHGGRRVMSVAWPGMAGVVTGMNDAGLVATMNMAFANDLERDSAPSLLRIRELLERDGTPAAAVARSTATPRPIAMNLMLAGPSDAMVVELSGRQHAVRRMSRGCAITTNYYESLPFGGGFGGDRSAKLRAAFDDEGSVSPLAVKWSLLRVAMIGSAEGLGTIQSVVFDPANGTAEVAIGKLPAAMGRYHPVGFPASRDTIRAHVRTNAGPHRGSKESS